MPGRIERRASLVEVRAAGRRLEGHAAVFDDRTAIADFTEAVARGAFADTLRSGQDVLGLVDHDPHRLLARTRNGTLRLSEDSRGLAFDLDVPDTTLGRDMLAMAERGDIGGASFAFRVPKGGDSWEGRNRTLHRVELVDVSIVVAFPAYSGTTVSARDLQPRALPLALARRYIEGLL